MEVWLKAANMRLKKKSALQTIQQGWKDDAVEYTKLGAGLDLTVIPQGPQK